MKDYLSLNLENYCDIVCFCESIEEGINALPLNPFY